MEPIRNCTLLCNGSSQQRFSATKQHILVGSMERRDFTDPGDYVCGGPKGQQLCSIIKVLETQTHELKSAMAGLKDISDTTGHPRSH